MKKMQGRLLIAIVTVVLFTACATMQSSWEETKAADTLTAYEDFLRQYPEGDLSDQARLRRNELQEENDWKDTETKNTVAAYEDFRRQYPQGRRKNDVYARLEMLSPPKVADLPHVSTERFLKRYQRGVFMDETLLSREKLSFEQARAEDTVAAYSGYLNRYPQGAFAGEARLRLEKLQAIAPAPEWGTIMYPKPNTNIRAKRSAASLLKGQLKTDQPVRADFLLDGWYAVFPVTQKERNEKMALGYVYAPLLVAKQGTDPPGSATAEEIPAPDTPLQNRETENLPVEVKRITFKAAGDEKELLFIEFDRFYPPLISGIEGDDPRIILEIMNAAPLKEEWTVIKTGGNFIRQIRSRMEPSTRAALIVLDMVPGKAYFVSQTFYKKENMFALEIAEKNEMQGP